MYYLKRVARGENKKRDSGTLGTLVIHQSAEGEAELWWQWSRVDTVKRRRRVCLHSHHGWRVVGVWGSDYWSCFVLCEPCCHRAVRVVVRVVSEPSEARAGCMQSDGIMTADMNGWAGAGRVEKGDERRRRTPSGRGYVRRPFSFWAGGSLSRVSCDGVLGRVVGVVGTELS